MKFVIYLFLYVIILTLTLVYPSTFILLILEGTVILNLLRVVCAWLKYTSNESEGVYRPTDLVRYRGSRNGSSM